MWNPFRRNNTNDSVSIHNIVVKEPDTGLEQVRFIVTADDVGEAGVAILKEFSKWAPGLQRNRQFGGSVVFTVRGPLEGTALPEQLIPVQAQLDAKVLKESLKTASGQPMRPTLEYKKSAF
jgi:hypothetical protein